MWVESLQRDGSDQGLEAKGDPENPLTDFEIEKKFQNLTLDILGKDRSDKIYEKIKNLEIKTAPYPGFPTDLQAQIMVLLCKANKKSIIKEDIFENRFMHVAELNRMGAQILTKGNKAVVQGNINFVPAELMAFIV